MNYEQAKEFFTYDPETGKFFNKNGTERKQIEGSCGLVIKKNGKSIAAHRLAWYFVHGEIPRNHVVTHINGDNTDNRLANLRLATKSQTSHSAPRRVNPAQYRGVVKTSANTWEARIGVDGVKIYLGCYRSPREAHKAYLVAAQKHYGDLAYTE